MNQVHLIDCMKHIKNNSGGKSKMSYWSVYTHRKEIKTQINIDHKPFFAVCMDGSINIAFDCRTTTEMELDINLLKLANRFKEILSAGSARRGINISPYIEEIKDFQSQDGLKTDFDGLIESISDKE